MVKVIHSPRLRRFWSLFFVLLLIFSLGISTVAQAEAVTIGMGAVVLISTLLVACGFSFSNGDDISRAAVYAWQQMNDTMRTLVVGFGDLCQTVQNARLQIPFVIFQSFSNFFSELFPSSTSEGGANVFDPAVVFAAPVGVLSGSRILSLNSLGQVQVNWYGGGDYSLENSGGIVSTDWGSFTYGFSLVPNGSSHFYPSFSSTVTFKDGASFSYSSRVYALNFNSLSTTGQNYDIPLSRSASTWTYNISSPCVLLPTETSVGYFSPPACGGVSNSTISGALNPGFNQSCTFSSSILTSVVDSDGTSIVVGSGSSTINMAAWAYEHYVASLAKDEDLLNYGVSRNPALTENPDCLIPQTVDGEKDVYIDVPALTGAGLDNLVVKSPADVAGAVDTAVDTPTLVEGADTNVGVDVPENATWLESILAWLKALLEGLLAIPGVIAGGIADVIAGVKAIPAAFADWFERLIEGVKSLGLSFVDWLSKLRDMLISLFQPTISIDDAFLALRAKAAIKIPIDSLISSIGSFRDYLSGLVDAPPSFSFVYMGNSYVISPFDGLGGYRRYWIAFSSFFMWFGFIRKTIRRVPRFLGGIT